MLLSYEQLLGLTRDLRTTPVLSVYIDGAAADPARRESKRFQDLTDAKSLAEEHPEVEKQLTPAERALLRRAL